MVDSVSFPAEEGWCNSPDVSFRDCSEPMRNGEMKFGIADHNFKPDNITPVSFSCQVRSLTYDVVVNHRTVQKCRGFTTLSQRLDCCLRKMTLSGRSKPRGLTLCIPRIFHKSPGIRSVTRPVPLLKHKSAGKH